MFGGYTVRWGDDAGLHGVALICALTMAWRPVAYPSESSSQAHHHYTADVESPLALETRRP